MRRWVFLASALVAILGVGAGSRWLSEPVAGIELSVLAVSTHMEPSARTMTCNAVVVRTPGEVEAFAPAHCFTEGRSYWLAEVVNAQCEAAEVIEVTRGELLGPDLVALEMLDGAEPPLRYFRPRLGAVIGQGREGGDGAWQCGIQELEFDGLLGPSTCPDIATRGLECGTGLPLCATWSGSAVLDDAGRLGLVAGGSSCGSESQPFIVSIVELSSL